MIIGITGHRVLHDPAAWEWVQATLTRLIGEAKRPLTGVTSLAIGADQMFARIVLSVGGRIEVVVPFVGYERTFERREDLDEYLRLKALASRVQVLAPSDSDDEAYLRAGEFVECGGDVDDVHEGIVDVASMLDAGARDDERGANTTFGHKALEHSKR